MKKIKRYQVNQSPLYKLSSQRKLATTLGVSLSTMRGVMKRGEKNYKFGVTESKRDIQIPKSQLYRIHSRINTLLSRVAPPDYLMSGVKGRSHVKNAKAHMGNVAVAKIDIKKFYPSTTKEILIRGFRKKLACSKDVAESLAEICTVNGYVPTGSPLSQSVCFFVNASMFDHLNFYAKSRGLTFTLYVDDLTFSGKVLPKDLLDYVKNHIFNTAGYRCHKCKTYGASTDKVITGVVVKAGGVDILRTQKSIIKKLYDKRGYYSSTALPDDEKTIFYFQRYIGHLYSAGEISPRYRLFGKRVVNERRLLGVKGKS